MWGPAPASLEEKEASERGRGFKTEGGNRMRDEEKHQAAGPLPSVVTSSA